MSRSMKIPEIEREREREREGVEHKFVVRRDI